MNKFIKEYDQVSKILEKFHSIFYKMWEYGTPELVKSIPTARIIFDNKSFEPLKFQFNPDFWNSIDTYTRAFVIAHECRHALSNHGTRAKSIFENKGDINILNQALDVAVNHSLINHFGFEREKINGQEDICWVDTVFPNMDVSDELSFEEYYDILLDQSQAENNKSNGSKKKSGSKKENGEGSGSEKSDSDEQGESGGEPGDAPGNGPKSFDDHRSLFEIVSGEILEEIQDAIEDSEIESYNDKACQNPGSAPGKGSGIGNGDGITIIPKRLKLRTTDKWEKLVKTWKRIGYNPPDDSSQWVKLSRRFASLPDDIILPHDDDPSDDEFCKSKLNALIFLDVSSSCSHLKNQFFMAYETIPEKRFNKTMYIFGDKVKKITGKADSVSGAGFGTSFYAISLEVDKYIAEKKIEPDIIIVITDGDANHPAYPVPDKWHFFIDSADNEPTISQRKEESGRYMRKIPGNIKSYYLVDYFLPPNVTN